MSGPITHECVFGNGNLATVLPVAQRTDSAERPTIIHAHSQEKNFLTRFTNGEHIGDADTTAEKGGGNRGFRPHELLEAALATCMNMTLRSYAQKHDIPLPGVSVVVTLSRGTQEGPVRTTLSKNPRFISEGN